MATITLPSKLAFAYRHWANSSAHLPASVPSCPLSAQHKGNQIGWGKDGIVCSLPCQAGTPLPLPLLRDSPSGLYHQLICALKSLLLTEDSRIQFHESCLSIRSGAFPPDYGHCPTLQGLLLALKQSSPWSPATEQDGPLRSSFRAMFPLRDFRMASSILSFPTGCCGTLLKNREAK